MKVYLSGDNVIVDKAGESILTIRQDRARYTYVTLVADSEATTLIVEDTFFNYSLSDLILSTETSAGVSVGTTNDAVKRYLNKVMNRSNAVKLNQTDFATSSNQTTIIAQNTEIEANILEVESNTRELNKIKELTKETNKVLKKIYN